MNLSDEDLDTIDARINTGDGNFRSLSSDERNELCLVTDELREARTQLAHSRAGAEIDRVAAAGYEAERDEALAHWRRDSAAMVASAERCEALQARITAGLALHRRTLGGFCSACAYMGTTPPSYPCPTVRALEGNTDD